MLFRSTVTVSNTLVGYRYTAYIRGNSSETLEHTGNPLVLNVDAPNKAGSYAVGVEGRGGRGSQDCIAQNGSTITVTSDAPGRNPCPLGGNCPTALGNIATNPQEFAKKLLGIAIGIAGGIALILMVVGSVRVLTSSGDPQKVASGREMITAAIAGLLFLIFSVLILRFIGINILSLLPP